MKLQDLIIKATEKAQAELDKRRQHSQSELIALDNAEEGIRYFVELLLAEIANVGRPQESQIEHIQHQGPDSGNQQEDQSPQPLGASGPDSGSVESAE